MKIRSTVVGLICLIGLAVSVSDRAQAGEVLYDGTGFMVGQQTFTDSFVLPGPGTLTITLSDVAWPDLLASLDLVVGTAQGLLGPEMGVGTQSFQVSGGDVFAQWFGTAQGPLDAGAYGLKIEFAPSATPVPLPSSVVLLLSGLLLLGWRRHKGASPIGFRAR